jgi:cytidylate kinase
MGRNKGIVMDGRDIGTVVFPEADLKIFMTASPEVRAMRRYKEATEKGENVNYEEVKANIIERDHIDSTRKESPLRRADDAFLLDNSLLTREEQTDWIVKIMNERFKS